MVDWWNTKGWKIARNMGIAAVAAALGYIEKAAIGGSFDAWSPVVLAITGFLVAQVIPKIGMD